MSASPGASGSSLVPLPCDVASEVLTDSVRATARCPRCCTDLNKSVFVDGDSEDCTACGEALWFELRGTEVIAHAVDSRISKGASTLGDLLRQHAEHRPTLPGSPFDD